MYTFRDIIDNAHQHEEHEVCEEGSPSEQKPADQGPTLEINLHKDSSAISPVGAESSRCQEPAQPIQQKPMQQMLNMKIGSYKDKGKARVESVSPPPETSTSIMIHNCPPSQLTKEQTSSS